MKKLNRCCSLITGIILLLSLLSMCLTSVVSAEGEFVAEQKVYCSATMNDAFADDSILVVLNNEASLEYLETEKVDFPEVKYKRVRELTGASRKRIKSIIEERKNTSLVERMLTSDPNAHEIAEYHHVVCIELEERGKEKVLESSVIKQNNSSTHVILYPCCNNGTAVSHTWGDWANYNALNHRRVCVDCGYEQLQKHNYLVGDTTRTCTVCYRSEIIPGGGILSINGEEERST